MNNKALSIYKVTFSDGTIEKVFGLWASHAWAIAQQLFPNKTIKGLELASSHIETRETQTPAT